MKAHTASVGGVIIKCANLNGLPSFLQGENSPILKLFGYTNRKLRARFINEFKNSEYIRKYNTLKNVPEARLLEKFYSDQRMRFNSFWSREGNSTRPIENERKRKIPDILIFLLHAYDPECFSATFDENYLPKDTSFINEFDSAVFESALPPGYRKKENYLRYWMLWPKLVADLKDLDSKSEEECQHIAGAVFALASAYATEGLLEIAIGHSGDRLLNELSPLLHTVSSTDIEFTDQVKPWEALVKDLQSLIAQLSTEPSSELLDEIESTVAALRTSAAEHQAIVSDRQFIEDVLNRLKGSCAGHHALDWLTAEIETLRISCAQSGLAPNLLKKRIEGVRESLEKDLSEYCEITDSVNRKTAALDKLNAQLATVSLQERPKLRSKQKNYHEELGALEDRLSVLESGLAKALNFDIKILTPTPNPEIGEEPSPAAETEPNTPEETLDSQADQVSEPEPVDALTLLEAKAPQEEGKVEAAHTVITQSLVPELQGVAQTSESKNHLPIHAEAPVHQSMDNCLLALAKTPEGLSDEGWLALGRIQRRWLEQRQPLRAWMLATEVERRLTLLGKHIERSSLLPSWACRLLLRVSDAKLPLSDEETDSLYKIRTLDNDQKELVVLWITAALLENATDKPLRIARLVSPQQFDLPPHSLALCCAEHLLTPVFNGGALRPPKDQMELMRNYDQAISKAQDIINPNRNNYQKSWVKSFWRSLIAADGPMGQILAEAKQRRFPIKSVSAETIVEGMQEWSNILAAYRNNMKNRMDEFAVLIETAKAAHNAQQEALKADRSAISKQSVRDILECASHESGGGWWLIKIKSGMVEL